MKSEFGRVVVFTPVLFFVFSAFMLPQNPPVNQPKPNTLHLTTFP